MRHFCYFRGVFFGKDLPLFLTKKISKKQNCGLPKFLPIPFKNDFLLKQFSDSKSMTLLDIKTYHDDIFVTNTIRFKFCWKKSRLGKCHQKVTKSFSKKKLIKIRQKRGYLLKKNLICSSVNSLIKNRTRYVF
jgi:hypothetical protein